VIYLPFTISQISSREKTYRILTSKVTQLKKFNFPEKEKTIF